jgi:hypothetical protein
VVIKRGVEANRVGGVKLGKGDKGGKGGKGGKGVRNPNYPSTTGKPSGKGRGNTPKRK